jgi:hypothetical protein
MNPALVAVAKNTKIATVEWLRRAAAATHLNSFRAIILQKISRFQPIRAPLNNGRKDYMTSL